MVVFLFHPVISKNLQAIGHPGVSRDCHTGLSERSEVLGRIKAEVAIFPDPTRALRPFFGRVVGADRLGCIFNDGYTVARTNRLNFVHRAAQAKKMDRYDRLNLKSALRPNRSSFERALGGKELV